MYSLSWAWDKFGFLTAFIFAAFMVAWQLPKRGHFVLRVIAGCGIFVGETFLFEIFVAAAGDLGKVVGLLGFIVYYLFGILLIYACFRCGLWAALFSATSGYCMEHLAQRVYSSIYLRSFQNKFPLYIGVLILTAITVLFYVAIYFLAIKKYRYRLAEIVVDNKIQIGCCVLTFMSIIILSGLISAQQDLWRGICVDIFSALCAFILLLLQFTMLRAKKIEDDAKKLQRVIKEKYQQFQMEKANAEQINIKVHDLRHQLNAHGHELSDDVRREFGKVLDGYDSIFNVGNEAIDTILSKECSYCIQHGIRLTCMIDGRHYSYINDHELYTLFGNALENAINSVEKLPEEKRSISITEMRYKKFAILRFSNYFAGKIVFNNGLPVTEKDKNYHGFGMRSIQLIAEEYGGLINVYTEDDIFTMDIFLPEKSS